MWVITRGFPWFLMPFLVLGYPLLAFYVKKVYNESRPWIFFGLLSLDICILVFVIWIFTDGMFPWFLFVWGAFGIIFFLFWKKNSDIIISKSTSAEKIVEVKNDESKKEESNKEDSLYPKL